LRVDQSIPKTEEDIEKDWDEKGWVLKGGAWRPKKCQAVSKVNHKQILIMNMIAQDITYNKAAKQKFQSALH
jgi:hypothetical protein